MPMTTVRIHPTESTTRILVHDPSGNEILKARLPPLGRAHRLATRTLLEAIALHCNARVRVVLSADAAATLFAQGLCDGLGFGVETIHYEIEIQEPLQRRRRLRGLGDFRDVRRLRAVEGTKP